MKKIFIGFFAIIMSATLFAAPRTAEEAAAVAAEFTNTQPQLSRMHKAPRKAANMRLAHTVAKPASNEAALYIFNQENNEGFVIVSADDNAVTILGYSDEGAFNVDKMPANMRFWLDYYAERIAVAKPTKVIKKATAATAYDPVAPLLGKIKWGQDEPYNNDCPIDKTDNTRSATGCVATAAAQIMRFWKHPVTGTGEYTDNWNNSSMGGKGSGSEYANFGATTYDWENMLEDYMLGYNSTQAKAVSTLMRHVGISCKMCYGGDAVGGSGAYTDDMGNALKTYFKYKSPVFKEGQSTSFYQSTFAAEVKAGRPVLMGGETNKREGHEFVCDGIDKDGLFHINWGWDGTSNGFFALSALDPEQQGTGGAASGDGFAKNIDCVYNIFPDKETVSLTNVAVSESTLSLKINEKKRVYPVFTPELATNRAIYWTSENEAIATVSCDGKVVAVAPGTTRIVATSYDGNKKGFCNVTVVNEQYTGTALVVDYAMAVYDDDYSLPWKLKVYDKTTEEPWVNFNFDSGSANKIAGIYELGSSTYYWPDASNDNYAITSESGTLIITLVGEKTGANGCNTYHIQASFEADDLITYTIDATLEVCAQDANKNAITLKDVLPVAVTGVTVTPATATIDINEKKTLTANITPSNATIQSVTWSSNHPEIATVNEHGKVTGVAQGTAVITATTLDGGFTSSATITVTDQMASVTECDPYSFTFTQAVSSSWQLGDYYWNVSIENSKYTGFDSANDKGAQFGSQKNPAKTVTFTTSAVKDCLIGDVIVNASMANSGDAKLSVLIDDESLGQYSLTNAPNNYTFVNTKNIQGNLTVKLTNTKLAMYLKSIKTNTGATATDIEQMGIETKANSQKLIENGQLVIIVDGHKYNALGQTIE